MPSTELVKLEFQEIDPQRSDTLAILRINRPQAANAFDGDILQHLQDRLQRVAKSPQCRLLLLTANGKHFSSGADLAWMQAAARLSFQENLKDAAKLTTVFETLANLPIPTLCVVHGAAYGGAVGLIAACDVTVARDDARFCLSEVKLGLLPAVIYPYLARRMLTGPLRRYSLSGQVFGCGAAHECGLIDLVATSETMDQLLREEINHLLAGNRLAQAQIKQLHQKLAATGFAQSEITQHAIAKARTSQDGQAGLSAFFAKNPTPWAIKLSDEWSLHAAQ